MINKLKQLEFQLEVASSRMAKSDLELVSRRGELRELKTAYHEVSSLATKAIFDLREEEGRTTALRKVIRNYELFTILVGALVLIHVAFIAVHTPNEYDARKAKALQCLHRVKEKDVISCLDNLTEVHGGR